MNQPFSGTPMTMETPNSLVEKSQRCFADPVQLTVPNGLVTDRFMTEISMVDLCLNFERRPQDR